MKCFCGVEVVFNERRASPELLICPSCGVEYKTPFFTSHKAMENVQIRTPGKAAGGELLPTVAEKLAEPEDKFFVQVGPVMRYGSAMAQKIMAKAERGDVNALNLIVLDVSEDDDHPAASRVEDESMCIVQVEGHPDRWWPAEEFFLMVDVKKFKVTEGDL